MYDTKTIAELEQIATNLRAQIALHPHYRSEPLELKECERWIELRRREANPKFFAASAIGKSGAAQ